MIEDKSMSNSNDNIQIINTEKATAPGGHYSQAIKYNDLIFISGQLGFVPGTSDIVVGSVEEQTKNCINNMKQILLASGSSMNNVIKTTIYISDVALWPEVNTVYAEMFGAHKPSRAIVPCNKLHHGFDVEIEGVAVSIK